MRLQQQHQNLSRENSHKLNSARYIPKLTNNQIYKRKFISKFSVWGKKWGGIYHRPAQARGSTVSPSGAYERARG